MKKVVAAITITGFECIPTEISNILQIEPLKVWRSGDPVVVSRPNARKHQENGWRYAVEIIKDDDHDAAIWLDKAVRQLMCIISASLSRFNQLPANSGIEISCYARVEGNAMPVINFDKEAVRLIAVIGASIDVDIILDD